MTDDKELNARLRDFEKVTVGDARDAADRIEALTAERDGLLRVVTDNHVALQRAEAAETKLAKAVEGLEKIAGAAVMEWTTARCGGLCDIARATLAEIKSSEAAPPYGLEGESHD